MPEELSGDLDGDFPFPGLELGRDAGFAEVLDAHAERSSAFTRTLGELDGDALVRDVDVPENGPHVVLDCVRTVLEEAFWHLRYATRDLDVLAPSS